MTPLDWTVIAAGAAGVLAVLWYFFGTEFRTEPARPAQTVAVRPAEPRPQASPSHTARPRSERS